MSEHEALVSTIQSLGACRDLNGNPRDTPRRHRAAGRPGADGSAPGRRRPAMCAHCTAVRPYIYSDWDLAARARRQRELEGSRWMATYVGPRGLACTYVDARLIDWPAAWRPSWAMDHASLGFYQDQYAWYLIL
jgi:hypothetical protein